MRSEPSRIIGHMVGPIDCPYVSECQFHCCQIRGANCWQAMPENARLQSSGEIVEDLP